MGGGIGNSRYSEETMGWAIRGLIPGGGKGFLSSKAFGPGWSSPNPFFNGPEATGNKWEGGRRVKLIIPSSGGVKSEWRYASAVPYTLMEYTRKLLLKLMSVVNLFRYGRLGREGRSFT
jgi:hypothetical protein